MNMTRRLGTRPRRRIFTSHSCACDALYKFFKIVLLSNINRVNKMTTRTMLLTSSICSTHVLQSPKLARPNRNPLRTVTKPKLAVIRPRNLRVQPVAALPSVLLPCLPSLYGGLSLGVLALTKLVVSGRILGISGAVKGIVNGDSSAWRYLFLAGLLAGGVSLGVLFPAVLEAMPAAVPPARLIGAGFLVGLGTSLGSGCTSGHGICGNARLSPRSFVSTLTFMFAGAIAAALLRTNVVFDLPSGLIPFDTPSTDLLAFSQGVLAASIALLVSVFVAAKALIKGGDSNNARQTSIHTNSAAVCLDRASTAAIGFLFALGLGAAGMLKPSKVGGFLSILGGSFDPSLMLVMGGALFVALPGFQLIMRSNILPTPICATEFSLPKASNIDLKLVLGSALFGAGWGTAGVCPGPGLVAMASGNTASLIFVAAMVAGMQVSRLAEAALEGATRKRGLA